jgi:alpha-beta hydrolase superfamily lysophospholipase
LSSKIDASLLSHDPNVADHYRRDRLVHQSATARYYFEMKKATAELMKPSVQASFLAQNSSLPILFQVAGEDEIVDSDATEKFYAGLKYGRKKFINYPGLYHELYNEISKDQVFDDLIQFVSE